MCVLPHIQQQALRKFFRKNETEHFAENACGAVAHFPGLLPRLGGKPENDRHQSDGEREKYIPHPQRSFSHGGTSFFPRICILLHTPPSAFGYGKLFVRKDNLCAHGRRYDAGREYRPRIPTENTAAIRASVLRLNADMPPRKYNSGERKTIRSGRPQGIPAPLSFSPPDPPRSRFPVYYNVRKNICQATRRRRNIRFESARQKQRTSNKDHGARNYRAKNFRTRNRRKNEERPTVSRSVSPRLRMKSFKEG